ncbi:MAG: nicotinate phosphoribosyltransferase [Spirochaetes bacterium GWD1_61_31]|nr:MAG: nicotinate phosphoribosyltransferase [Spirochaetes bacterium GWB1_60_80]OHD34530.1 MAG: nicotinate phosphoribosyltransferase [Spirochaetes bacterium GWC1_61_12]OHD38133.1 MAG: nicotinate phosphoribosyltransferase [Spirochaetes bacterium GWD1_61_31]OHD42975.1 MAG: nicotinate phosphoribosyltransferase [Spirochaetes bacterium GWE1_60_18]OHD58700.1 MAG: nicotinate phosphoribosyltransferase [Spirochaetes bacterium GWF1_60_12]HAP44178.1 nicotinate phosphoribosyltransferase [Spirochaetaceae b
MFDFSGSYTDQYELTMACGYYKDGRQHEPAVFDYFFRRLPFGGDYAVFAGLEDLLGILEHFRFNARDLTYLRTQGFSPSFLAFLESFRFRGSIRSCREGDLVFPSRPILQVEGTIIETQLVETLLLNMLNFQTLIATKASRIRLAAGNRRLIDFGLRRAQGPGGYYASRAAFVGGFDATSNVAAGRDFGIPMSGTMAHSFVQSFDDELSAFRSYAASHPTNCVLLVDTYDTLRSGLPNAITVAREMSQRGQALLGIRLDSGDLAQLAKAARSALDQAGFPAVKIAASNQLDEHIVASLLEQGAPLDIFGVGTALVTGHPDGALDGVYKLALSAGRPSIKLSENPSKISIPGRKQVYRLVDRAGRWLGVDLITRADETPPSAITFPFERPASTSGKPTDPTSPHDPASLASARLEPLLETVMENGRRSGAPRTLAEIAAYARHRLLQLPPEYRHLDQPAAYRVGLSQTLADERASLIAAARKRTA